MTAYHGGKQRLGKKLAEIIVDTSLDISEEENRDIVGYCEPFCGMLGVYRNIPSLFEEEEYDNLIYLAGDTSGSVIKMWQAAQKGWKPPTTCSEKKFNELKNAPDSALRGFIGHQCSFGGRFFTGFSKNYDKSKNPKKASERVVEIAEELYDTKFYNKSYEDFSNLKNFVIYCDPPYSNTQCNYNNPFNNEKFWKWCTMMSKNNIVFVSEYSKPKNIKGSCIFSNKKASASCAKGSKCSGTEKLYIIK